MMDIRVLLVDDQEVVRSSLRELIEVEGDIVVVGEAANGDEALVMARALTPTVMVVDLRMPRRDGLWTIRAIRGDELLADTRILVLTTFENDENVVTALREGANGFVGKTAPTELFVEAIRTVASGASWLSTTAATSVVQYLNSVPDRTRDAAGHPGIATLTGRELEIVKLVAAGMTNEQIAEQLTISRFTVKTHVNRAMAKLGVPDRAGLVSIAYRSGLVAAPPR